MSTIPRRTDLLGRMLGHFRVVSSLGRGGMGAVYGAWDERLRRAVALKVLTLDNIAGQDLRKWALHEARAAAAVTHPNLAAIHEVGEAGGVLFIAMELVRGETVRSTLIKGALPLETTLSIAIGVARGLAKAHESGIVHGDIKPENVIVAEEGQVKILDFGLSHRAAVNGWVPEGDTRPPGGEAMGTPHYMSPEQAWGQALDPRSDVFSFGALLYEMLTGRRPFPDDRMAIQLAAFTHDPLRRPSDTGVPVPAVLDDLVAECLSGDKERRPENGKALLARLTETVQSVESSRRSFPPASIDTLLEAARLAQQPSTNLGASGHLIGREAELAELRALVTTAPRLVTLFGPGGTGKTRLALHLAALVRPQFPGGTWLCDLSDAKDEASLLDAAGRALGIPPSPGDAPERIAHALAARGRVLMVLDNFDQIVSCAAATLVPWMRRAPDARFVVTSREVLRIEGETVYPLSPLSLPEPGASLEELSASGAVQLFVERARAAQPSFTLGEENAETVAALVRRLDGLPLAIELAAARSRALDPRRLLERMPRRFELLSLGPRDASPRQATMRGAIEWSWNLLSPWERSALAQCAVFRGGFSLEAAEAVIDVSAWPEAPWVPDVVQALCDKSLLRTWQPPAEKGELRYGMYESIGQYAAERLHEMSPGVARAALARHLSHHAGWAAGVGGEDGSRAANRSALDLMALEHENLRIALDTSLSDATASPDVTLRLGVSMWRYWLIRVHYAEGKRYLEAGVERWTSRDEVRARALGALAGMSAMLGEVALARSREEEALSIWRELGARAGEARSLTSLGFQAYRVGDLDRAMTLCLEGLDAARDAPGPMPLAFCLNIAGMVATKLGRIGEARLWLDEAVRVCRQAGNRQYLANVLESLGTALHAETGDHAPAVPCYRECLEIYREMGDLGGVPYAVERFAQIAAGKGDAKRAAVLFGASRGIRDRLGAGLEPVMEAEYAPLLSRLREALDDRGYADAYERGRALRTPEAIALALLPGGAARSA